MVVSVQGVTVCMHVSRAAHKHTHVHDASRMDPCTCVCLCAAMDPSIHSCLVLARARRPMPRAIPQTVRQLAGRHHILKSVLYRDSTESRLAH
jgi:hypothetical protein